MDVRNQLNAVEGQLVSLETMIEKDEKKSKIVKVFEKAVKEFKKLKDSEISSDDELLYKRVKDQLQSVISIMETRSTFLIESLPDELILQVFSHLSPKDAIGVSKKLQAVADDQILWKKRALSNPDVVEYLRTNKEKDVSDWKQLYRDFRPDATFQKVETLVEESRFDEVYDILSKLEDRSGTKLIQHLVGEKKYGTLPEVTDVEVGENYEGIQRELRSTLRLGVPMVKGTSTDGRSFIAFTVLDKADIDHTVVLGEKLPAGAGNWGLYTDSSSRVFNLSEDVLLLGIPEERNRDGFLLVRSIMSGNPVELWDQNQVIRLETK